MFIKKFKLVIISIILAVRLATVLSAVPFTRTDDGAVYSWHRNKGNKIAITFDDGPHSKYTPEILDILDEYGVKATFFVVGSCVGENPELVRLAASKGHEIANHTFSHADLKASPAGVISNEIMKTENAVYEVTEMRTKLLRPPEGKLSREVKTISERLEYKIVLWTVDTRDWAHTSADVIYKNVIGSVKSGDIVLFHDYVVGESHTAEALRRLIPELLRSGYSFVTVSELINSN